MDFKGSMLKSISSLSSAICWISIFAPLIIYSSSSHAQEGNNNVGLVAYWKMEEGSGELVADSGGNGYDQHLVSSPATSAWSTDVPPLLEANNYSVAFDGTDD